MESEFWIKKWQQGEIRFHQSRFHPELEAFGGKFTKGTILVPLCGKSLDMLYLVSKGHSVIGAELSPIACQDFFKENEIPHKIRTAGEFTVFESDKITLWCGDFFKLPKQVWDNVTGLYDRAALVALPEALRQQYAAEITKQKSRPLEMLLISFEYPQGAIEGPPFSVPEQEIKTLYKAFSIEKLREHKEERISKDNPRFQSIDVTETVYWIRG